MSLVGKCADDDDAEVDAEDGAVINAASLPAVACSAEAMEDDSDEIGAEAAWVENNAEAVSLAATLETAAAAATGNRTPC